MHTDWESNFVTIRGGNSTCIFLRMSKSIFLYYLGIKSAKLSAQLSFWWWHRLLHKILSVTQRWQQQGNLPTASFYFQPHHWKCPDNRAAGRISATQSSEFTRERRHKMKIKGAEARGDDRQECMKGRCTGVFNAVHTEIWLRQTLLVSDFSATDLICSHRSYVRGKIKLPQVPFRGL